MYRVQAVILVLETLVDHLEKQPRVSRAAAIVRRAITEMKEL